jgi:hypothetical protein
VVFGLLELEDEELVHMERANCDRMETMGEERQREITDVVVERKERDHQDRALEGREDQVGLEMKDVA